MKIFLMILVWFGSFALPLSAMGFTEDPQEKLTKTLPLAAVRSLEIRGQVEFELVPGPEGKVTVETTRALFDQLNVSNWWGAATVAIESGLRGPREQGSVKITMTLPSLQELVVSDHSIGRIVWPGTGGTIKILEGSSAVLELEGNDFIVATSWMTRVTIKGHVLSLAADLRHQSSINGQDLQAAEARLSLDENSTFEAGPTDRGAGTARHQSRVIVAKAEGWEGLVLREDSVRVVKDQAPQ